MSTPEAPWVGVTPEPPVSVGNSCNGRLNCTNDLHKIDCHRNVADVHRAERKRRCSNEGHDWNFLSTANGDLKRVSCDNCGKTYECVEV